MSGRYYQSSSSTKKNVFQRRFSSLENFSQENEDGIKPFLKINDFFERQKVIFEPSEKTKGKLQLRQNSESSIFSSTECLIKERQMTENLKEIHKLIERMQKMTRGIKAWRNEKNDFSHLEILHPETDYNSGLNKFSRTKIDFLQSLNLHKVFFLVIFLKN